jgi:hypothetical protein
MRTRRLDDAHQDTPLPPDPLVEISERFAPFGRPSKEDAAGDLQVVQRGRSLEY